MTSATMERHGVKSRIELIASGSTEEQIELGRSAFSGTTLFVPKKYIDPITSRPYQRYWGKSLTPGGIFISKDGTKQAETEQALYSAEED